ncbi:hypothetical protein D3C81_2021090 [compost metagenome]
MQVGITKTTQSPVQNIYTAVIITLFAKLGYFTKCCFHALAHYTIYTKQLKRPSWFNPVLHLDIPFN